MTLQYKFPRKFVVDYSNSEQALRIIVRALENMQIEVKKALDLKQDKDEELDIKYYNQNSEPTLAANEQAAFWKDADGVNYYLVLKTDGGSNVKVELT